MSDDLNHPWHYRTFAKKIFVFFILLFLLSPLTAQAQKHPCHGASTDLSANLQVVMGRGGIWTFMEQSSELREKSIIGLQVDGKLSRAAVIFETLCNEGKYPTKAIYDEISSAIGDGRMIYNLANSSDEKKLEAVNGLNQKLDTLLSKLPN
jgi:hypothetical protein